ncbi:MAG TPA: hypothetical protein VHU17_15750 [Acidimicrobiales bacterium]|nr:hypothetical protein [Acidimicrobiales bacterium]
MRTTVVLGVPRSQPVWYQAFAIATMVLGAATIVVTGAIHLHLWMIGYKNIASIGNLFLAQAISGFVLGPVIVLIRRMYMVLAGAAFMAASIGGLVLSATVGFLGLHDALSVPWATPSLVVEIVGFVLLVASGLALVARR